MSEVQEKSEEELTSELKVLKLKQEILETKLKIHDLEEKLGPAKKPLEAEVTET